MRADQLAARRPRRGRFRAGGAIADGDNGRLLVHETRVQPPAVVLEGEGQRIQPAGHDRLARHERRLQLANAIEQYLDIVEPPKHVLAALERTEVGFHVEPTGLGGHFVRIPQLLERDAHRVQPLGQVQSHRPRPAPS